MSWDHEAAERLVDKALRGYLDGVSDSERESWLELLCDALAYIQILIERLEAGRMFHQSEEGQEA